MHGLVLSAILNKTFEIGVVVFTHQNFTVKSVFSCCNIFHIILVHYMLSMSIRSSEISGSRHVFSGLRKIKEVTFFKRNLCETGQMGK